jgi:hypothetical protein
MTTPTLAQTDPRVQSTEKLGSILQSANLWQKGQDTVVQLKGQASEDSARCQAFQVRLTDKLAYKIQCIGQELTATLSLESSPNQKVTRKGQHLTITQYGFLIKKPRVSKSEESTLKVPFVQQIIHLKSNAQGQLSFYLESFKEDEFGRIVQDSFLQAHSLQHKKMEISAH